MGGVALNGVDRTTRRATLDSLTKFNQRTHARYGDPETLTRIAQYEMAFRMQASVPELTDFSKEDRATLDLYGAERKGAGLVCRELPARAPARRAQRAHRANPPPRLGSAR